ncbi:MAG: hypothetical protein JNJ83_11790 [Verrucomicrobiaceae bacterium]|nr:hypothetical protein [Verrucomicrobiaceae bacterium]
MTTGHNEDNKARLDSRGNCSLGQERESIAKMQRKILVTGCSAFLILFGGYAWFSWVYAGSQENRAGQFGDAFGALNAFISGLALFGVIYAILQQHSAIMLQGEQTRMQAEELKLQREELAETRAEIARGAEAQRLAAAALSSELRLARFRTDLEMNQLRLAQVYTEIHGTQSSYTHGRSAESITDDNMRAIVRELQVRRGIPARPDPEKLALARKFERALELRERRESLYIVLKHDENSSDQQ